MRRTFFVVVLLSSFKKNVITKEEEHKINLTTVLKIPQYIEFSTISTISCCMLFKYGWRTGIQLIL